MRNEIVIMAKAMERKLAENDHKCGWGGCDLQYLSMRITQEKKELVRACQNGGSKKDILNEAADVANFAMMIADNYSALQSVESPEPTTNKKEDVKYLTKFPENTILAFGPGDFVMFRGICGNCKKVIDIKLST